MEELMDFDQWILQQQEIEIKYWAVYDPNTGNVIGIYPSPAGEQFEHRIEVDREVAENIQSGITSIQNCFVDITSATLEIAEVKSLTKIDDVLHRVTESRWSEIVEPDIFISYKGTNLTVEMTEKFHGTRKVGIDVKPRKVHWSGNTEILLLVTDYNDPNVLYHMLSLTIDELIDNKKVFEITVPGKFSVYTRRIFKNYVLEV